MKGVLPRRWRFEDPGILIIVVGSLKGGMAWEGMTVSRMIVVVVKRRHVLLQSWKREGGGKARQGGLKVGMEN